CRSMTGVLKSNAIFQHILIEHTPHGIGVHGSGVSGLDNGVNQILGLCRLSLGLLRPRDNCHAVASHDNRQLRESALNLTKNLVNRAKHGYGIELRWN
ncbi:hypothetical protein QP273_25655, partial [Escherichia coli]|nr:hypothetical protein [Escherichia coli]